MVASSSNTSNKVAVAALAVLLLALLAGPAAAGQGSSSRPGCFVGWSSLFSLNKFVSSVLCLFLGSNPFPNPQPAPTGQGLSVGYYNRSGTSRYCPQAEELVYQTVQNRTSGANRGLGAGLIRLHFHDAFVRGCDASVLLDKTASNNSDTEKTGLPNKDSLRGFEVIRDAKTAVEKECPGVVSCADILAFAARDASYILSDGYIDYEVPAGRYDGRESFADETDQLPGPDSTLQQLSDSFVAQGLNLTDAVTLSGAHSVGRGRCILFKNRLSAMDPGYASKLNATCNVGNATTTVNQDDKTPDVLDNQYYKNIDKFVLFKSDAALNSSETIAQVTANAGDNSNWAQEFGEAMVKMGKIKVITSPGYGAEIRLVCSQVN